MRFIWTTYLVFCRTFGSALLGRLKNPGLSLKRQMRIMTIPAWLRGWGNITKEINYSTLNINTMSFISFSSPSEPVMNLMNFKVARYSFSRSIPPKFERKLRRHKQRFGKINTTVVLDKDETLLWSGLQWHRICHSNEMRPLPILLAAVFLGSGNCSSKIVY